MIHETLQYFCRLMDDHTALTEQLGPMRPYIAFLLLPQVRKSALTAIDVLTLARLQMENYIRFCSQQWGQEVCDAVSRHFGCLEDMRSSRQEAIKQVSDLHERACNGEKKSSPEERAAIIEVLKVKLERLTSHAELQVSHFRAIEVSRRDLIYGCVQTNANRYTITVAVEDSHDQSVPGVHRRPRGSPALCSRTLIRCLQVQGILPQTHAFGRGASIYLVLRVRIWRN